MCVLYVDSVWVLNTPNTGWNMLFHIFFMKNIKQGTKVRKIRQNTCFWALTQTLIMGYKKAWTTTNLCKKVQNIPWPAFGFEPKNNCSSFSLLLLPLFTFFMWKTWQKHILTSIWSGQYPNAGQNIQHLWSLEQFLGPVTIVHSAHALHRLCPQDFNWIIVCHPTRGLFWVGSVLDCIVLYLVVIHLTLVRNVDHFPILNLAEVD